MDETQMIPGYTGKTGPGRKLISKPEIPYPEYEADMEELATSARSNIFPGSVHNPEVMESNTHRSLKATGKVWEKGYEVEHGGKLCTIFSAPNYCDQMGNQGAFIRFKADASCDLTPRYVSFSHVPHPEIRAMQYANRAFFGPMFGGM